MRNIKKTLCLYLDNLKGARIEYINCGTSTEKGLFIPFRGNNLRQEGKVTVMSFFLNEIKTKVYQRRSRIFTRAKIDGVRCATHVLGQMLPKNYFKVEDRPPAGFLFEDIYDNDGKLDYSFYLERKKKSFKDDLK